MQAHVFDTRDRLLVVTSHYELVWCIRYRVDHISARHPPLWRPKLLGKALQTVRRLFRDGVPPPTRHRPLSLQRNTPSSREYIFEMDRYTRQ